MPAYSRTAIKRFLKAADTATTKAAKGKIFEDLTCYLFGILIAANGITGSAKEGKAAHHQVSLALAEKIRLIVITRQEIEGLKTSADLVAMIKTKLCQLIVSGTIWP